GQPQGQHGAPRSARTNRATASVSAPTGARRTMPPGTTISTVGSGIIRTAANDVLGAGEVGAWGGWPRRGSSRRLARNVTSPIRRAGVNAVTDCPDSFQAATVSRQNRSPRRRRLVFGTGWASSGVRKPQSYPTPQGVPRPDAYDHPAEGGGGAGGEARGG